jgi:hypothetical protein
MHYSFLFLVLLLFSSCADIEKEEQVNKITRLRKTVSILKENLSKSQIENIAEKKIVIYSVIKRIKSYYYLDTIDMDFAKKMEAYKVMGKSLKSLEGEFEKIRVSLDEEKVSLKTLQSDIKNGFGHREKYNQYIGFEKNKIEQIKQLLNEYKLNMNRLVLAYDTLHFPLNEFSLRLEEKYKKKYP